jgi:hypothetical protein
MIVDVPVMVDPIAKLRVEERAEEEESDPGRDDTSERGKREKYYCETDWRWRVCVTLLLDDRKVVVIDNQQSNGRISEIG